MVVNKVSVIVPIYKVERFIENCVRSLMAQTLKEVEYIFVDDASPDKSMTILSNCISQYPERMDSIKILFHRVNMGLPAARNTGLLVATGEYIFHCDSDDFVEYNMLESLYYAAKENNADFVWSDWFLSYRSSERYMKQPGFLTPEAALKGMLSDALKFNVWNKLVKRELYFSNNILFPSGHSMGEDMTMIRLLACSKKVFYVPKAFYHYVQTNSDAMTRMLNDVYLSDINYNVDVTLTFLKEHGFAGIEKEIAFFKLNVKLPFLISCNWKSYKRWNLWYPEANIYIMDNMFLPIRTRLLQWMALKKIYVGIWLYNFIFYKFLYRLFFRR